MSKSTTKTTSKKSESKKSEAPVVKEKAPVGASSDALNGRIAARTHFIHAILCEAYSKGATLSTSAINDATNAILASYDRAPTTRAATASHLNTMRLRDYVEHVNGRDWRLTALGAELVSKSKTSAKGAELVISGAPRKMSKKEKAAQKAALLASK